jgi:hypothetical protein
MLSATPCSKPAARLATGAALLAILACGSAAADEFALHAQVGRCDYVHFPQRDERHTECTAEAYLTNKTTSDIYFCKAEVRGDQYVAPSVQETAPTTIQCTWVGQPFGQKGVYDFAMTDDTAKPDRTLNRVRGTFSWANGFWIFSQNARNVKFCTRRLAGAGPDFRISCSKDVEWRR